MEHVKRRTTGMSIRVNQLTSESRALTPPVEPENEIESDVYGSVEGTNGEIVEGERASIRSTGGSSTPRPVPTQNGVLGEGMSASPRA